MPVSQWKHASAGPSPAEYARRIEVLLSAREFERAKLVVDQYAAAVAEFLRPKPQSEILNTPLADTSLSARLVIALDQRCVFTVRDLLNLSRDDLREIRGFGEIACREILRILTDMGFTQAMQGYRRDRVIVEYLLSPN